MDRGFRRVRAARVVVLVSLLLVVGTVPARGAFPGGNGLLVVQPASGRGLLLVGADGARPRQICPVGSHCGPATDPVWSPNGSEIAFASPQGSGPSVIYPDGSCLACPASALSSWYPVDQSFGLGFLPDGRLAVRVGGGYFPGLGAMGTDGIGFQPFKVSGSWQQPAWSLTGQLAAVRSVKGKPEVFVIDPQTGSARQLTRNGARSPSWSPDGRRLAVVHRGWIGLVASSGGRLRRLAQGGAPAWAPDGKQVAFVGARHRLFVIAARGGTSRAVGHIRAVRVDWQPMTGEPLPRCQAPASSSVLAATPDATIMIDRAAVLQSPVPGVILGISPGFSVLGCLTSDGRERLLESLTVSTYQGQPDVGSVAVAGDYAALVNEGSDLHYGGSVNTVAAFNLRTGTAVANDGGESADCPEFSDGFCSSGIDQLAVSDTDGATAAHTFVLKSPLIYPLCTSVEQIVANDRTGMHVLDSITTTTPCDGPTPALLLSQLSLSGHTLTWSHAGTPESAQLN
jgi:hypothetical protein